MTAEQRKRIAGVLEAMALGLDEIHAQDEDVVPALALFLARSAIEAGVSRELVDAALDDAWKAFSRAAPPEPPR